MHGRRTHDAHERHCAEEPIAVNSFKEEIDFLRKAEADQEWHQPGADENPDTGLSDWRRNSRPAAHSNPYDEGDDEVQGVNEAVCAGHGDEERRGKEGNGKEQSLEA